MTKAAFISFTACIAIILAACSADPQVADQQSDDTPPPIAKSGPSFSQTRDFIIANLSMYAGFNWTEEVGGSEREDITDVHIDNACRLSFEDNTYYDHSDTPDPLSSKHTAIPLGAVTDIENQTRPTALIFNTGNINAVSITSSGDPPRPASDYTLALEQTPPNQPGEEVPDDPEHMEVRLKDALMHLVGMCKGRYFAKPKKLEPF